MRVSGSLLPIVFLSLQVSGLALLVATVLGLPLGAWVGLHRFPGRGFVTALLYTGWALPPVVVGLAVYLLLSREGPLAGGVGSSHRSNGVGAGSDRFPVVAALTASAVQGVDPDLRLQLRSLGASPWQETLLTLREARPGIMAALVAGFGSIISEVGAVMLVGGNVEGQTRVLTTAS
jgi:tungstate transport system permease protein